ncbi:MAG: methyltransferase domain-containing protein [Pseudomonadota bacterium]
MAHVCPWWFCYTFDNPLRRLVHDPHAMLAPWVRPGATCLDLGCGMGYFTIGLARLAAPNGRVVAVDLQEKMLERVSRRAAKAGVGGLVRPRQCGADSLGVAHLAGAVDFALAFWMLHEVPDVAGFLGQVLVTMGPSGRFLVTEPRFHVDAKAFAQELALAEARGWRVAERPEIWGSHAALLGPAGPAA